MKILDTMLIVDQPTNGKPAFWKKKNVCPRDKADVTIRTNTKAPITCVKKEMKKNDGFPFVSTARAVQIRRQRFR